MLWIAAVLLAGCVLFLVCRRFGWVRAMAGCPAHTNVKETQFLATFGHEVRTPMTGILGMCELLLQTQLGSRQRRYALAIQSAGEHLLHLVNNTLDLARMEAGKLPLDIRPFSIHQLISQVKDLMQPNAERKGLTVYCYTDAHVPQFFVGDAQRIRQVLLNLVANAIKFTEHGHIAIRTISTQCFLPNTGLQIEVVDTGPGLNKEQCQRVFQRFEQACGAQTLSQYGGSGLGLAICQELVHLMQGQIGVKSSPGQGCRFYFKIPAALQISTVSTVAHACLSSTAVQVLLVEDDLSAGHAITTLLHCKGYQVCHAHHGLDALRQLRMQQFDIALCNLDLPGIDGCVLASIIRAQGYVFPMIALCTAFPSKNKGRIIHNAGFSGVLQKPVSTCALEQSLRNVLGTARKK